MTFLLLFVIFDFFKVSLKFNVVLKSVFLYESIYAMAIDKFLYLFIFFFREIVMRKLSSSFQFWRENGNKRNKKTEEKTRENTTGYIFRICVASSRRIQAFKVLFHYFSYNLYKNKSSFVAFGWMHWIRYDFVLCLGFWSIFTYCTTVQQKD